MSVQPSSKVSSSDLTGSTGNSGFYLQSRTKIGVLAVCLALMIGASVYSVLQPLNPKAGQAATLGNWLLYPHETNPYASLQAVHCAQGESKDYYACRLNSVAVKGAGNLAEVWAVGNFGLVLHRKAGESKWEQLTITAKGETASNPSPTPSPAPTPVRSVTPTPTPVRSVTPTPTPGVPVPFLIGRSVDEARKMVSGSGFQLEIEYEKGSEPEPNAQEGSPLDLQVIKQTPEAKTLAQPKSTIKVLVGRAAKSGAGLLDSLVPTVYAAALEKPPQQNQPALAPSPSSSQGKPAQQLNTSASTATVSSLSQPIHDSPLDDDLISVSCYEQACTALGRSGRIYKITDNGEWTFLPGMFIGVGFEALQNLTLLYKRDEPEIIARLGTGELIGCQGGGTYYNCVPVNPATKSDLEEDPAELRFFTSPGHSQSFSVGHSGLIKKNTLTATSRVPSATTANLHSVSFAGPNQGFIVGDHGTILSTSDGGNTWRHETQGPEGGLPNHRLPAGWYWVLAFLMVLACSVVVAAPPPPSAAELSVADWTVTDAPLKPGDLDSLDFTPMALGLSRFIRNPKTQPPVTIAIEGEWGEGKSSVMALLRGDLEKSRFRPVWFNAWHHQSEDQLLAALLEHIKSQAVPPWWHIDNWIFRARLLHFRFRQKWPLMIMLVLVLCGSVAFELSRHGLKWEDVGNFGRDLVQLAKYLFPWSTEKNPPQDLGHFGLVVTMIAVFGAIFKKAQAFGINPAKLTDNLRDAATIKDVKPDPGIRRQFAREFGDLCKAWSWGSRRVIIFIDDLDRCRPESVVTVLESINFLTTAGDCLIVLGIAQKHVTHCVGLSFKDIALTEESYKGGGNTDQEKAIARFNYGALYIKKLVNIVAPLPKTTQEQRRRVLEARAAAARRQDAEQKAAGAANWRADLWESLRQTGEISLKVAPMLGLALSVVLAVLIGYQQGTRGRQSEESKPAATATQAQLSAAPVTPEVKNTKSTVTVQLLYNRPTTQPATLAESDAVASGVWWSYAVDALFLVVLFGVLAYQLSARTNLDAQNSPEFEDSLKLWGQYIVGVCDTPREIKRALNDLRYQAMTRRRNGPSATRGERLARSIRQFVTGRPEPAPVEIHVDEAALPPRKAAELANLTEEEWKVFLDPAITYPDFATGELGFSNNLKLLIELKTQHIEKFERWIGAAKLGEVRPAPEPVTDIGTENAATRTARQA